MSPQTWELPELLVMITINLLDVSGEADSLS